MAIRSYRSTRRSVASAPGGDEQTSPVDSEPGVNAGAIDTDNGITEPGSLTGEPGSGDGGTDGTGGNRIKRKYTRRTEGTPGRTQKAVPASVDTVTELLVGIHVTLAMALQTPEIAMDEDEGKAIAKAYLDMQRHYAPVVSGKTLDTMRFCMVIGAAYGGRMVRINMRKKSEHAEKRAPNSSQPVNSAQQETGNVVSMQAAKPPREPITVKPTSTVSPDMHKRAYEMMQAEPIPVDTRD